MENLPCCAFCGHTQEQVHCLAGGTKPDVFICDECLEVRRAIMDNTMQR